MEITHRARDIYPSWNPTFTVFHALYDARGFGTARAIRALVGVHYLLAVAGLGNLRNGINILVPMWRYLPGLYQRGLLLEARTLPSVSTSRSVVGRERTVREPALILHDRSDLGPRRTGGCKKAERAGLDSSRDSYFVENA